MKFNRPDNISDNAFLVLEQVFENLYLNFNNEFDDFSKLNLSTVDLDKACKELHDKKFVIYCHDRENKPYLIAQGQAIDIIESYR